MKQLPIMMVLLLSCQREDMSSDEVINKQLDSLHIYQELAQKAAQVKSDSAYQHINQALVPCGKDVCYVYRWLKTSEKSIRQAVEAQEPGVHTAAHYGKIQALRDKDWSDFAQVNHIPHELRMHIRAIGYDRCEN
jgi:hypothetical protein